MNIYEINNLGGLLSSNTYPGRGIVIGKSEDGKKAVFAYRCRAFFKISKEMPLPLPPRITCVGRCIVASAATVRLGEVSMELLI